jgi:hypothetical protein
MLELVMSLSAHLKIPLLLSFTLYPSAFDRTSTTLHFSPSPLPSPSLPTLPIRHSSFSNNERTPFPHYSQHSSLPFSSIFTTTYFSQ